MCTFVLLYFFNALVTNYDFSNDLTNLHKLSVVQALSSTELGTLAEADVSRSSVQFNLTFYLVPEVTVIQLT